MSDVSNAAPAVNDGPLSIRDAVGILDRPIEREQQEPAAAEPSAPPPVSSQEEDTGPAPEPVPGDEQTEEADPADAPSIEPPRSWSRDHKEAFKALPQHLQQMVAESERAREADFLRRTNEVAEKAKATEAERKAAEQARQQYEQALPTLYQQFATQFQAEFSDIKTWDDVSNMRQNDPMRFMAWQEAREKGQALAREAQAAQSRQMEDRQKALKSYADEQDRLFVEKAPEFSDKDKAPQLISEVRALLTDVGFDEGELNALYYEMKPMSLRDHRVQLLVRDAMRFRAAEKARAKAAVKPVPPVQRPGVPISKSERASAELKALDERLSKTGDLKDAVALLNARSKRA